ncbi:hypothetical protein FRC01_010957 [Tulasnella sp. 417]|nr:hypothetical protein FRC01_010957 [Tulasnella sp. 417]
MEIEQPVYGIPTDIPPPLEHAAELLTGMVQTASKSPRNTQKILHLISRGIEILNMLRTPFSKPPSDLYEMITAMESLRKLEFILMEARNLIEREAVLPVYYTQESAATWFTRRDRLRDLLIEAHALEFNPPTDWKEDLEEVVRVDDHLWVGLIAHDLWNSGKDVGHAQDVERIATKLLEPPASPKDKEASSRQRDIERAMMAWERARKDPNSSASPFFNLLMPRFGFLRGFGTTRSASAVPTRQGSPVPRNSLPEALREVPSQQIAIWAPSSLPRHSTRINSAEGAHQTNSMPRSSPVADFSPATPSDKGIQPLERSHPQADSSTAFPKPEKVVSDGAAPPATSSPLLRPPRTKSDTSTLIPTARADLFGTVHPTTSVQPLDLSRDNADTLIIAAPRTKAEPSTPTYSRALPVQPHPSVLDSPLHLVPSGQRADTSRIVHATKPLELTHDDADDLIAAPRAVSIQPSENMAAQSTRNKRSNPGGVEQVESIARELLGDLDEVIKGGKLETTSRPFSQQGESPRQPNPSSPPLRMSGSLPSVDLSNIDPMPGVEIVNSRSEDADTVESQSPVTFELTDEQANSIVVEKGPRRGGNLSDVYMGHWTSPWTGKRETVAIKIYRTAISIYLSAQHQNIDPHKRRMQEVLIWQKLKGLRITPLLGYTSTITGLGGPAIISPWRKSGVLDEYVEMHPEADKLTLLIQAAEAVNFLHTLKPNSIIHGDVKPRCFLINDNDEVELFDFGSSRVLPNVSSGDTQIGCLGCTCPYMAPELYNTGPESTPLDVYSFGGSMLKVLYFRSLSKLKLTPIIPVQVLTGKPPFASRSEDDILSAIRRGDKPNISEHQFSYPHAIVDELWKLMSDCWSLAPNDRPTMAAVIERARNLLSHKYWGVKLTSTLPEHSSTRLGSWWATIRVNKTSEEVLTRDQSDRFA